MRGKISEISIVGLIQMFHDGRQSGRLRLSAADGEADVYFDDGDICRLDISGPVSTDGPYDIFRWRTGEFEFDLTAEIPPGTFDIPLSEFLTLASECERRWYGFARYPLETLTFIRPTGLPLESAGVPPTAAAAVKALGDGRPLIAFAQLLDVGLLDAAEIAEELQQAGLVVFETAGALRLAATVQDLLNQVLKLYTIFAGKVLGKKLMSAVQAYSEKHRLPVTFKDDGVEIERALTDQGEPPPWRELAAFVVHEMAKPVGEEAARLLWEKAVGSLEPAAAPLAAEFALDTVTGKKGGKSDD
jgi:hypothetical protein